MYDYTTVCVTGTVPGDGGSMADDQSLELWHQLLQVGLYGNTASTLSSMKASYANSNKPVNSI